MEYSGMSPALRYAIASFQHGLVHYLDGTDLGRRFALLHIDQAIELMIKERLVRGGKSVYKSDGTTLTLHEALNSLCSKGGGVALPERPRLEELHSLRNNVQHQGLALDAFTAEFFVLEAYKFAQRFLGEQLDVELGRYLSVEASLLQGRLTPVGTEMMDAGSPGRLADTADACPIPRYPCASGVRIPREDYGADTADACPIPLYSYTAGDPIPSMGQPAEDSIVLDVDPASTLVDVIPCTPGLFALQVRGSSMISALVNDGDILVLRRQDHADGGDFVAVRLITEGETTLKRFFWEDSNRVRLQPANPQMKPVFVRPSNLEIKAKVVAVIRQME